MFHSVSEWWLESVRHSVTKLCMNLLLRILAVGSLVVAPPFIAAKTFEGNVAFTMTSGSQEKPMTMNYSIKGQKLRMDMEVAASSDSKNEPSEGKKKRKLLPGFLGGKTAKSEENDPPSDTDSAKKHQISTIMDVEKMEMLMLMPEQNMYMVMPVKKAVEKAVEKQGEMDVDVQKTGKTETILGYKAEQILVTEKKKKTVTELWITKELAGTFMGLGNAQGGGSPFGGRKNAAGAKWEEVLKDGGGFPLRVVTNDANGKESLRMEATKIEPTSLPDSMFVPPPGYQKFEMPDLGSLNPFKRN